ncbi:imelysin family protein [Balneatrix alpica]|uniref:Imelysin family protein n=1 Tax=Balneatrix alpica TaxID=75684 RepID=A0ABV5Z826_9GAMM|nr:imelysin family protein [Balneatrix alpica]
MLKPSLLSVAVALAASSPLLLQADNSVKPEAVVSHYADIALAGYQDSLSTAETLLSAVQKLVAEPTEANLQLAREAWIAARVPYQQTEVYRFGNAIVDEWEGKVNAWPLDEGLIDYVAQASYGDSSDENPLYSANVIANPTLSINGKNIDASTIDKKLLAEVLHEAEEVEANVATGYHAIEFLLWGQDLNGTSPGAGQRPATDYDTANCTGGNCDRRGQYLVAATELLIDDLKEMVANWQAEGAARQELLNKPAAEGLATMLTGMGSLAYGELAGERTKLGLMLHDPEEEHDCFSDNTHWSHYYDAKGIQNVYLGQYQRVNGDVVQGPSLADLVKMKDAQLDTAMRQRLQATESAAQAMVDQAKQGNTFDVLIGAGNQEGNQIVQNFVDSLTQEARTLEQLVAKLDAAAISIEGSDSLDNLSAVSQ